MEWHFFCTSHGKSSADGIGAVVKRGVSNRVLKDKFDVYKASEFVACARTFTKKINVIEVTKNEVLENSIKLQQRWKSLNSIPGTREYHFYMKSPRDGYIIAAISSTLDSMKEIKLV